MERPPDTLDVMLIDEVAGALKIRAKQIRRLERRGAFPIPRLPKLDRHPRYARALVQRFASRNLNPDDPPSPSRTRSTTESPNRRRILATHRRTPATSLRTLGISALASRGRTAGDLDQHG